MFLKVIFLRNVFKKNFYRKQMNNIYMDTPFSIHLCLLFLLWPSDQHKQHKINIPTKLGFNLPSGFSEEEELKTGKVLVFPNASWQSL